MGPETPCTSACISIRATVCALDNLYVAFVLRADRVARCEHSVHLLSILGANMTRNENSTVHMAQDDSGIRTFAVHCLTFFCLQAVVLVGIFMLYPTEQDDYLAAFSAKSDRLALLDSQRLVLVGGSNVAFGANCQSLETTTSRKVVNLGLHAGIGLNVMLEQALAGIRTGDLVVVSLEYEHFDRRLGEELWPVLAEHETGVVEWLQADDYAALADNARHYLAGVLRRTALSLMRRHKGPSSPYTASSFDAFGCIRANALTRPKDVSHRQYFGGSYSGLRLQWALDELSAFQSELAARGATLVVVHPPTMVQAYESAKAGILDIHDALVEAGFRVLSGPEGVLLDASLFYDTEYHLNAKGQMHRGEWLGRLLKDALP